MKCIFASFLALIFLLVFSSCILDIEASSDGHQLAKGDPTMNATPRGLLKRDLDGRARSTQKDKKKFRSFDIYRDYEHLRDSHCDSDYIFLDGYSEYHDLANRLERQEWGAYLKMLFKHQIHVSDYKLRRCTPHDLVPKPPSVIRRMKLADHVKEFAYINRDVIYRLPSALKLILYPFGVDAFIDFYRQGGFEGQFGELLVSSTSEYVTFSQLLGFRREIDPRWHQYSTAFCVSREREPKKGKSKQGGDAELHSCTDEYFNNNIDYLSRATSFMLLRILCHIKARINVNFIITRACFMKMIAWAPLCRGLLAKIGLEIFSANELTCVYDFGMPAYLLVEPFERTVCGYVEYTQVQFSKMKRKAKAETILLAEEEKPLYVYLVNNLLSYETLMFINIYSLLIDSAFYHQFSDVFGRLQFQCFNTDYDHLSDPLSVDYVYQQGEKPYLDYSLWSKNRGGFYNQGYDGSCVLSELNADVLVVILSYCSVPEMTQLLRVVNICISYTSLESIIMFNEYLRIPKLQKWKPWVDYTHSENRWAYSGYLSNSLTVINVKLRGKVQQDLEFIDVQSVLSEKHLDKMKEWYVRELDFAECDPSLFGSLFDTELLRFNICVFTFIELLKVKIAKWRLHLIVGTPYQPLLR